MTEAEWLADSDPYSRLFDLEWLLRSPQRNSSPRKWRLLACGVCRHLAGFVGRAEYVNALEIGEEYADSGNPKDMKRGFGYLEAIRYELEELTLDYAETKATIAIRLGKCALTGNGPQYFVMTVGEMERYSTREYGTDWIESLALTVARCVWGNPFRPMTVDPGWVTSDVTSLSRQMYESRDFSAMPILADALQDAGCDSADVLDHCRGPRPHVRGCWVVDLVLGKE
ncbi:hypothetical protein VT84_23675 [Gemmata sp. SH-PL17]|uniref:hypothetical protein n=1 Tax=Gemmata sp. SH-PL17 TaxID=1630693 RepID=UPI00078C9B6C|nr:hypothetical protein [Gemmata sp. SH-PL17]AMV27420.1 hypothetical protein VT84_23675 [Gemmata sp. SH-PL17]